MMMHTTLAQLRTLKLDGMAAGLEDQIAQPSMAGLSFEGLSLQIPPDELRYHYVKRRVRVHRYVDATLAVFYGPRRLARYDEHGAWFEPLRRQAA